MPEIFERLVNAAVNIHHISEALESIERNANWQGHFQDVTLGSQKSGEIIDKKIAVLKVKKQSHIEQQGNNKIFPLGAFGFLVVHGLHQEEIDKSGDENNEDEFGSAPAVKENAGEEDNAIFEFVGNKMIGQDKKRQEINQESDAAKYHICELRTAYEYTNRIATDSADFTDFLSVL
jgi:hypothetical protein